MATVLDLVKHYQHNIAKYPDDEQRVLKYIEKLFNLNVNTQHLQETGVGRTVNALRKKPGEVGKAARALVYKWKLMVAAEESDQEEDNNSSSAQNGHEHRKGSDSSGHLSQSRSNQQDHKHINGDHSTTKRKYHSSEDEKPDTKKSRQSSANDNDYRGKEVQVKTEPSDSDSQDSDSQTDSESETESSEDDRKEVIVKTEPPEVPSVISKIKTESSDSKRSSEHHSSKHHSSQSSQSRHSSEKSSTKSSQDPKEKHLKDKEHTLEKKRDHKSHKEESRSSSKHNSEKHASSSQKTESSSSSDRHRSHEKSKSDKHNSSNSKSDRDKHKSESEKKISSDEHKSKESSSYKDKSSSSKEKSKDRSSSSKEKSSSHSSRSEKKHSSSSDKSRSESKSKSDRSEDRDEKKSSHKSRSSDKSRSSSSKSKEDKPKKKVSINTDSDDGIGCESGASFAEALGIVVPKAKKKKHSTPIKDAISPSNLISADLSPATMLAPTAKLAPLPALEISALPEISPNYKPRPPPKFQPHFSDDDAMSQVISSKNQRTKVYSGNKILGKIPTLYEMCVVILQEHIDALEYTGGVPYEILKPVVDKATPQQLFMLEHYNPYLIEDTDHLWQKHCEKHFRNKKREEMETWREMYIRCQEEQEHKLKSLTANIRMTQEAKKAPVKQTKMAYVDTAVKPPRNIARKQALHGTAYSASASPAARVASLASGPNVLKGGSVRPPPGAPVSVSSFNKPKKAPLMQKALQFMRGRKR